MVTTVKKIVTLCSIVMLVACAGPAVKLQGKDKEVRSLAEAMKNQRWTSYQIYSDNTWCANIFNKNKWGNAARVWGPNEVAWKDRTANDVQFNLEWTCRVESNNDSFLSTFNGLAAIFTLGLIPVYEHPKLSLKATVTKGGNKLFEGKYANGDGMIQNLFWAPDSLYVDYFDRLSDQLIEQLEKELDREGALEI